MDQITDRRVTVMSKRAEPRLDPESREWMDGLRCAAADRDAILAQLYGLLLHAARHEAGRRNDWLRLNAPDLDGVAGQVAADALPAITARLDAFCGRSRFKTWASKFAMSGVSATAGRRLWQTKTMSLDQKIGTGSPPASRHTSAQNGTSCSRRCAGPSMRTSAASSAQCLPPSRCAAYPPPRWPPPAWQPAEEILRTFREPQDRGGPSG